MSQNKFIEHSNSAIHWICIVLLAMTLAACGGGGSSSGGGGQQPIANNDPGNMDPVDPTPPPVTPPGNEDPMPDPVPDPGNGGGNNMPNEEALFAATLHPVLTNPGYTCALCHNGANPQAIPFAVADVSSSYTIISGQGLVSLPSPGQSSVYQRPATNHNCGALCATIAADVLQAIESWAAQSSAANPPPPAGNVVASATTNFSQVVQGSVPRADANQITHFAFDEGAGNVAVGTSNVGASMTLNLEGMEWDPNGGLRNVSGKAQASLADSQKLFALLSGGNQFSVEAWVIPDALDQTGPARIVSYSIDTGRRNFTLGQTNTQYISRVQTINTGPNGSNPELRTEDDVLNMELTHVVMTYDNMQGGRKLYVNGALAAEENLQGDMLNWQDDNLFVLGNEVTNNRLWRGVYKMVAIHNRALNGAEVAQNFEAGEGAVTSLRFDVANVLGVPGYIEMQAYEMDPFAYVFARPMLVTDASGIQVKNMRIAVNNSVPVAAQAFRRVDMMVMQSGQEISSLGALIPSDQGMALDQFHLEFEVLAGQTGTTEQIAPGLPPLPPEDVEEPDVGVRTFSQVHDTFAALTGISQNDRDVRDRYNDLRDQLPPSADALGFGGAQQIAIQRLATTYCGEITNNNGRCRNFFNIANCEVANAGAKAGIAGTVIDRTAGVNLANQPDRTASVNALVQIMDTQNCANGCDGNNGRQVLQAVCAAGLASSAVTIN